MIKEAAKKAIGAYQRHSVQNRSHKDMLKKIAEADVPIRQLDQKEIAEIDAYWKPFGVKPDHSAFRWYYSVNGTFDPRYISEDVYTNSIWTVLNDMSRCKGLNDKNLFELLYPEAAMPETIFHNINGLLLDKNFRPIRFQEAMDMAAAEEKVVIKPAVGSCQGHGVACVEAERLGETVRQYEKDYIVQKVLRQHPSFAVLNESSVNVVRMTSLLLEDEVLILDSIVRVGAPESFTDHKNIAIGIRDDGTLKDVGFTVSGRKVDSLPNGFVFSGHALYAYSEMKELIRKIHVRTPQARLIGWDVTTDAAGNAVVIEANMSFPGIGRGQDCNGPFFGKYTDRVLKTVFGRE